MATLMCFIISVGTLEGMFNILEFSSVNTKNVLSDLLPKKQMNLDRPFGSVYSFVKSDKNAYYKWGVTHILNRPNSRRY